MAATPQLPAKTHYRDKYHLQMLSSPENFWLYGYLGALGVKSVFEFGCNAGRHLKRLESQGIEIAGMDINPRAVAAAGLINKIDVRLGDEQSLAKVKAGAYDAVFTVSVLSHIQDIRETLKHLRRIAKRHVLLVETRTRVDANNYWWQHDYPGDMVYSYFGQQVNAVYQIWHVRK